LTHGVGVCFRGQAIQSNVDIAEIEGVRDVAKATNFGTTFKGATTGGLGDPDSPKVGRTTPTFYVAVHETGYTIRILFCTIN